jgi:N-formylglutamate deformylase
MAETFRFHSGTTPLLVSVPHDSTFIPAEIAARMTPAALKTPDTDWHVAKLYDFAASLGASVLTPAHSRYVVDLNRDPAGTVLYPGADNTELCPLTTFTFEPIYQDGQNPDDAEIADRIDRYWRPYHDRLAGEIAAIRDRFGVAVLFDGHTIKSEVPRFFDGRIADLNLGTASGASADPGLARAALSLLSDSGYPAVLDDRFTGGYITRHYGDPAAGIHAVQLELTWRTYMDEANFQYLPERADRLKVHLKALLQLLLRWAADRTARK